VSRRRARIVAGTPPLQPIATLGRAQNGVQQPPRTFCK